MRDYKVALYKIKKRDITLKARNKLQAKRMIEDLLNRSSSENLQVLFNKDYIYKYEIRNFGGKND